LNTMMTAIQSFPYTSTGESPSRTRSRHDRAYKPKDRGIASEGAAKDYNQHDTGDWQQPQKDSEGKGWKLWSEVAGRNSYTGRGAASATHERRAARPASSRPSKSRVAYLEETQRVSYRNIQALARPCGYTASQLRQQITPVATLGSTPPIYVVPSYPG
jgi:hypothetical protein